MNEHHRNCIIDNGFVFLPLFGFDLVHSLKMEN